MLIRDLSLEKSIGISKKVLDIVRSISTWTLASIEEHVSDFMVKEGLEPRQLLSFLREAISGQKVIPPLYDSMYVLGKEVTIERLKESMEILATL